MLYPAPLRDLLIRLACTGLFRAKWTEAILDECFRNIAKNRPSSTPAALTRTRYLMNAAVPDCIVTNYASLIDTVVLPDANDRHVLAAAIRCGAQVIVTFNLRDFPGAALGPYDLEAQHPDTFVRNVIDLNPAAVIRAIQDQAADLRNPTKQPSDVLDSLEINGLTISAARLRELMP